MLKKGNASAEGTQRFVNRMMQEFSTYNQTSYRCLGGTNLMVSKVGKMILRQKKYTILT